MEHDEKTDPAASDFEIMQARAKRAARNSGVAASNSVATLAELAGIRDEFKSNIRDVNERINKNTDHLDKMREHVSDVRENVAGLVGTQQEQTATLREIRQTLGTITTATIEVTTARATTHLGMVKADHEDKVEAKKWTREQIGKVIAAVIGGGAAATAIQALLRHC